MTSTDETEHLGAPSAKRHGRVADAPDTAAILSLTPNRIVTENLLQGNPPSEWDIVKADVWTIEGFTTQFSVNVGETVDFKIRTDSTDYRIDIYRLGYYDGLGARRVDRIQHQIPTAQSQPLPERDDLTGLVDAGNWSVSVSWPVPDTAVSGFYIAKLVRQDETEGYNHIPFIVRDDAWDSDILFQAADTTWQAYNVWGGASLYGGDGPGTDPATFGRAYKVSYNRPFVTRWGEHHAGPQDFVFGVEFPAIRWLEKNGYDVSYIAGVDAARNGALLLDHKVFLSVGHDEYWAGTQRTNVEAARDAGVHLMFLSGNEVYWRTRWEPSIAGPATDYRTLVCYKETRAHQDIDPSGEWTGTYRDPRFAGPGAIGAGQPENRLTGTIFTVDSYRLDAIEIPYAYSQMRIWRHTSIADLETDEVAILPAGYLGYEWDSDLDNGFRPPGLINMSKTIVDVPNYLLDYGSVTGPATAEHNLTLYRAPSEALVFGAGTVYWAWGLDEFHDLEIVPDDNRVKQATVNLLADMGVQPETLDPLLVLATASTDVTPPISSINAPVGTIPFDQPYTITGTASDVGGVVGGVEISTDDGATWHKAEGREIWSFVWTPSLGGTYTLRSRATDDSCNIETPAPGIAVTVTGPTGKTLFSPFDRPLVVRVNDPVSLELGVKIVPATNGTITGIRFYKGVDNVGPHTGTLWTAGGVPIQSVAFTSETASGWQTALFATPIPVTGSTTYIASYHCNGFYSANDFFFTSSLSRNGLTAPASALAGGNGVYTLSSGTALPASSYRASNYWIDVLYQPVVVGPNQPPVAANDTNLVTQRNVTLQIAVSTLLANDTDPNGDTLTVTSVGSAFNGSVSLNVPSGIITFTPNTGFAGTAGFSYEISDGQGGTDTADATISVVAPPAGVTLFASNATPATITVSDANAVELGMKFVPSVNGDVTGLRFYKGPLNTGTHVGTLWDSIGNILARVTFVGETASGWQVMTFAAPYAVTANTTYIISYHCAGNYSASSSFFATSTSNGPLTAPDSASVGGNGVFAYAGAPTFPTSSFNDTNYWVDVFLDP